MRNWVKSSKKMLAYNAFYGESASLSTCSHGALGVTKNRRGTACRAPTVSTQPAFISFFALVAITITARLLERVTKQITHHFDVIVARMVQARKPESTFDRFE